MKKVIKTNMHVYTITENGGKVSMVSDNPNANFNFEGIETSIDSVMQRFEVAMKLRGEVISEVVTDGWVDGEPAWEDDGTKPEAPADPEMKAWLESLGCKFDEDDDPKLETETAEDAPILAYEEVKFWAEQFDFYNLYMGEENRHVEYRCAVEDNWHEYLLRGWNIDVEHTKEYWDKFWKIYCNVMHDLWGEEYNIAVDNIHDQLIFTPMIDEDNAEFFWSERMEEIDGKVDAIARRSFFEENELDSWDETDELSSVIATVMEIDRTCQTNKIFYDTPIFTVGNLEVRYTSPCREFETGCILVNQKDGGMVGNWSELTEGWDECGLNPDELSAQMWTIIKKYYQKELDRVVKDMVADYESYGPGKFNVGNIQVPYKVLNRGLEDVLNSFRVEYDETGFATAVTIFETETRPHF